MAVTGYDIPGSMEAGRLRNRIQIERDALTYTGGVEVRTPEVYATVWAEVSTAGSGEVVKDDTTLSVSKFTFTIRYNSTVTASHRVIYRGARYEIANVTHDEARRSFTVLDCISNG